MRLHFRSSNKGLSLIEILIALALIVTAGTIIATNVYERYQEGNANSTKIQMQALGSVLEDYRIRCNGYPSTLDYLINPPENCPRAPQGGFISNADSIPDDAWGNPFEYQQISNREYLLVSLGADASPGGTGHDADICSYSGTVRNCDGNEAY